MPQRILHHIPYCNKRGRETLHQENLNKEK
jgi:hypothetical protein